MFQNQNTNESAEQTNLSQKRDLKIENIPIHTMQKDLEAILSPKASSADSLESDKEIYQTPRETPFNSLSEIQKTSPFLNTFSEQKKEGAKTNPEKFTQTTNEKIPQEKPADDGLNQGKYFAVTVIALIVSITVGAGYYFWTTRQDSPETAIQDEIVDNPPSEPAITPEPESATPITAPQSKPVPSFSLDKPNYLPLNIEIADSAKIKETLFQHALQVTEEKTTTPVEFLVTDLNNNPVSFKTFADKLGMKLSPTVLSNLKDSFTIFVYNDNGKSKTGLAVDSKDDKLLKSAMLQEEKNLAQEIEPLFLTSDFTIKNSGFRLSNYSETEIRYLNITSPDDLSVDYAITKGKLLFGTTKMTLRSIIDYLDSANSVE